ncbi:unnamed protein product [Rangifer tarandus platyrhynchus]|uniref:Uncharacterized protein n=2 Tax=Rangifer tarandus platyrhynchus TaxID=3082113 RepID=A0ACB0E632_RANTA|nr:unnamed protein product [Rangifer tarandus platyrhynchus]CAI9695937.1 unnamed protein product [Rangifer tarandus platyrhynchus]
MPGWHLWGRQPPLTLLAPPPHNNNLGAGDVAGTGRGLQEETAPPALTGILRSVISGLTSVILILLDQETLNKPMFEMCFSKYSLSKSFRMQASIAGPRVEPTADKTCGASRLSCVPHEEHGVSPESPEGRRLNEMLQGIRQLVAGTSRHRFVWGCLPSSSASRVQTLPLSAGPLPRARAGALQRRPPRTRSAPSSHVGHTPAQREAPDSTPVVPPQRCQLRASNSRSPGPPKRGLHSGLAAVTARRDVWRECSRRPSECHAGLGSQRRTAAPCAPETRRVRTKGADRGWRQLLPRGRGQRFRFAAAPSVHSAPLPRAHRRSRGAGRVAPRAAGEGARSRVGGQGSRRGAGRKGGLPGSGGRPGSGEAELGARVVGGARDAASPGTWRASRVHADCWVARALAAAPYGALEG